MARRLTRKDLAAIGVLLGILALAHYFGWLSEPPRLLAPGTSPATRP